MAKRVLVPFDDSRQARSALDHALAEYPNDEVTAIHVLDPAEWGYDSAEGGLGKRWHDEAIEKSESVEAAATEMADERGVDITTVVEDGVPSETVVGYADEHDIDHIVVGSHGRSGATRLLLGSVAEAIARSTSIPVTIVG
ncbi:universal stress protein [Halococcus sp. IIIV-5B]|uniref:universal stress protein n=1 Tax=Halococcus sp. IIIV-5B TaxID=2321230 RepID=UPI000E71D257|nr:universal stress protein [Halococcus sp. IIIV-5B]RJS98150.1 universal stress protein [Halococcus sp. IIIV-5B]